MNPTSFGPNLALEQPIYVLPQIKKRSLIPKTVLLILLGVIFYLGILINVSLLNLTASYETQLKIISLFITFLLVILGVFLDYSNAKKNYLFYKNKIIFKRQEINYNNISNTQLKQNILDKIFQTSYINLGKDSQNKDFIIKNIPYNLEIVNYIKQLKNYSKNK